MLGGHKNMKCELIAEKKMAKNGRQYINFTIVNNEEGVSVPVKLTFWNRKLEYALFKKCEVNKNANK